MVQGFFVIAGMTLSSIQARALDLDYAGYGGFFLFFGAFACWQKLREDVRGASRPA